MKTKVKFIKFKGEVLALFPDELWNLDGDLTSYAHMGQHGAASPNLLCMPYTSERNYRELKRELESIGYDLEVMKGKYGR